LLFDLTPAEEEVFSLLSKIAKEKKIPTYLVGGYVRDKLLQRPSVDIDIVCLGSGIILAQLFSESISRKPKVTVYKRYGTAMVQYKNLELEFVGARKESYSPDSRKPSVEEGTLEDDQNRRDFTINALALSLNEIDYGTLIDPFDGREHLNQKLIKTPLDPHKTFEDDPLRMMRAIRFSSQLAFEIHADTFKAIQSMAHRIEIVSKERIAIELNKIILSPRPSTGFLLLYKAGLLQEIFPDFVKLYGVENFKGVGHKDNFYHTLQVLDNVAIKSDNLWLRWAAILHDIAKPQTKKFSEKLGWTFHGHEVVGAAMVPRIFRSLKLPMDHQMKYVQKLVRLHLRPISLTKEDITDSAVRRLLFDAGNDIDDLMILCEADITSKNEKKVKRYLENYEILRKKLEEVEEKDHLRNWQPPISGEFIMETFGIKPSKTVGTIKTAIREAILEGHIKNDFEEAERFMIQYAKGLSLYPKT
jgi:putative nucleotidyltransferase with HDIG domain